MGKIVCEVCGTSYSDAATQCPICGCASPAGVEFSSAAEGENVSAQPKYQYVKGGRFSKANVKKRNNIKKEAAAEPAAKPIKTETKNKKKKKGSSNKGLVITVLILLLAIIAVIAYIAVTFVLPVVLPARNEPAANTDPTYTLEETDATQKVACVDIEVDTTEIYFNAIGETMQINASPLPANVSDEIMFISDDTSVVTVDADGIVTAVGVGDTVITVACGDISVSCTVSVLDTETEFAFDLTEVTLSAIGEEALIYSGTLPLSDIVWSSDDEQIAMIQDGNVIAVGSGTTTVYGEYNDLVISCIVNCTAEQEETVEATVANEDMAAIEENGPYRLHNPYGVSDTDASIKVGVSFTLYLLDKNDEKVSGVKWSVENGSSCKVVDGKVTGISKGNSEVVATYGGKTYTCIVRVS